MERVTPRGLSGFRGLAYLQQCSCVGIALWRRGHIAVPRSSRDLTPDIPRDRGRMLGELYPRQATPKFLLYTEASWIQGGLVT